ncbi:TPA: hypothetical protein ACW7MO_002169, partial [Listeria monocytogenes]
CSEIKKRSYPIAESHRTREHPRKIFSFRTKSWPVF